MLTDVEITELIDCGDLESAVSALNDRIATDAGDEQAWFLRGKVNWKRGNHSLAISDYEHAVAINENSNARHALEMSRDIINFFNPDLLNP